MSDSGEITQLLRHAHDSPQAGEQLHDAIYEQLRGLARSFMARENPGQTLQPTALVHEAYLKLIDQTQAEFADRAQFFAYAATVMRRILINKARDRAALKRGGEYDRITLSAADGQAEESPIDLLAMNDALERLAELDERQAKIVEMRYFGGMGMDEISHVMSLSKSTVEKDWRMARIWLQRELAA